MITLREYNEEIKEFYARKKEGWIGIACDQCGHELKGESSRLMTNPPQQNIWCDHCGWKGRRYV